MKLQTRLKSIRRESGHSQEDQARFWRVSRQTVSKWESGLGEPSIKNLIMIANKSGIDLHWLIMGAGDE